jgi:hypothetical protein
MHGGGDIKQESGGKVAHATIREAVRQADQLNRRTDIPGVFEVYPCRWGSDHDYGENAPEHWHVGRPSRA